MELRSFAYMKHSNGFLLKQSQVRNIIVSFLSNGIISLKLNLACCTEKVSSCLVSSDGNLDRQAVWHVDTHQRICGTADAVPKTALGGRHGVYTCQHVQPLCRCREEHEGRIQ